MGLSAPARRLALWGALIFIVALGLRLLNLYYFYRHDPIADVLILDGWSYDRIAQRILNVNFWGDRVFFQDPLYPYFLAAIYRIFGHQLLAVKVIQTLLGATTALFIMLFVFHALGITAAVIAGLLAAGYPLFIFYDCLIMKETLGLFFTACAFYVIMRTARSESATAFFVTGAAFGLAVLTRGNLLLFIPFLLLWAAWRAYRPRQWRRLAHPLYVAGGIACVIAPVAIRNRIVGGEWVLLTSQGGANFFIGNNPYSDGAAARPPYLRMTPEFEEADFEYYAEQALGKKLTPTAINAYWKQQAWEFIHSQPEKALQLTWRKIRLFFNWYEIPDNYNFYFYRQYSWILYNPLGYGVVLATGLVGMVMLRRQWRQLLLFYLMAPVYSAAVIMFHVYDRYRMTIVPFLMIFTAGLISTMIEQLRQRQWRQPVLASCCVVALLPLVFRHEVYYPMSQSYFTRGVGLTSLGRFDEAALEYQKAIDGDPCFARAYTNLGKLRFLANRFDDAERMWLKAIELDPSLSEVYNNLGTLRIHQQRLEEAIGFFTKACELRRDYFKAQFNLAQALLMVHEQAKAVDHFALALVYNPDDFLKAIGGAVSEESPEFRRLLVEKLSESIHHEKLDEGLAPRLRQIVGVSDGTNVRGDSGFSGVAGL